MGKGIYIYIYIYISIYIKKHYLNIICAYYSADGVESPDKMGCDSAYLCKKNVVK